MRPAGSAGSRCSRGKGPDAKTKQRGQQTPWAVSMKQKPKTGEQSSAERARPRQRAALSPFSGRSSARLAGPAAPRYPMIGSLRRRSGRWLVRPGSIPTRSPTSCVTGPRCALAGLGGRGTGRSCGGGGKAGAEGSAVPEPPQPAPRANGEPVSHAEGARVDRALRPWRHETMGGGRGCERIAPMSGLRRALGASPGGAGRAARQK